MVPLNRNILVFLAAASIGWVFALYTSHTWEDYYITYRSSHNLATGHGLVFNHGDRLHTFTSPIGVLLPAMASILTGTSSELGALWVYRALSIFAFAGAATLLFMTATRLRYSPFAGLALVAWMVTDAKGVDFTINGMEIGFLLLFFAYSFWALFGCSIDRRRVWHLAASWSGLMWTRPDSFIYIILFFGALLIFNRNSETGATRLDWLKLFTKAALLAILIYLPWLLFSWIYYGSPIPHTIIAKAGASKARSLAGFFDFLPNFPYRIWVKQYSVVKILLMPSYTAFGGWPTWILIASGWITGTAMLLWTLPWFRTETRAASLALLGAMAYLTYFPPAVFPWYLCLPSLLAFLTLSGAVARGLAALPHFSRVVTQRVGKGIIVGVVAASIATNGWLLVQVARQVKAQQYLIEDRNRQQIGLWLRETASPTDTVMLEPLGYIGYFSRLKTYDVPGLSSREVVEAIQRVGINWDNLINELEPTWLVLRDSEIQSIDKSDSKILGEHYEMQRVFDVAPLVQAVNCYGRTYLEFDSRFTVYRLRGHL